MRVPVTQFREAWVWMKNEEKLYARLLRGYKPILHLFCGTSKLGDIRVDREDFPNVTHRLEVKPNQDYKLPFPDKSFDATIFDPPWINQFFVWASREIPRITRRRIIAVTGNFWFGLAKPYCYAWSNPRIYVVKGISPVVKLVFVYDFTNKSLILSGLEDAGGHPPHPQKPAEAGRRLDR